MPQIPTMKRGDTFAPLAVYRDSAGNPINLSTTDIASQVRDGDGSLIATLSVTKMDQTTSPGKYSLFGSTDAWPVNRQLLIDIRYLQSGVVVHTETASFKLEQAVTMPPP